MSTAYSYDPLFLEHDQPGHPENSARLLHILKTLSSEGLLSRMVHVAAQPATAAALASIHAAALVARVRQIADLGGGYLDLDTYVSAASYRAAALAAGSCATLVRAVVEGRAHNAIALVRPPGHHATRDRAMGFCLFNNVALAAQSALDELDLERVLIVDWDVHHGNGTQDIFYASPRVLFFSTHQSPLYPGTGHWRETGQNAGAGYTINVPLSPGVGDTGLEQIYHEVLFPLAARYQPELILVSAGYDAHWKDPLAGLHLSLGGYWQLSRLVVQLAEQLCQGRVVIVLEGGYNLAVLGQGVANTCRALLGDPAPGSDPFGASTWPEGSVAAVLRAVKQLHDL